MSSFKIRSRDYAKNDFKVQRVATIKGGDEDGKYLFIVPDESGTQEIKLTGRSQFQPIPVKEKDQIERLYISGASGSGKSTYLAKYIREFLKMKGNKNKTIYLFSSVDYDPQLDDHFEDNLVRVLDEIDEDELIGNPLTIDDFDSGSVLIFDDTFKITSPKVRVMIFCLLESMLEIARHKDLTIIVTSHILSNYRQTRTIQNEATSVTVFPQYSGGLYGIKEYLKRKIGMSSLEMKRFLSLSKNSRWVSIYRRNPMFVLSSKEAYIFDQFASEI